MDPPPWHMRSGMALIFLIHLMEIMAINSAHLIKIVLLKETMCVTRLRISKMIVEQVIHVHLKGFGITHALIICLIVPRKHDLLKVKKIEYALRSMYIQELIC